MRHLLLLSSISFILSSCYVEVSGNHNHDHHTDYDHHSYHHLTIHDNLNYEDALLITSYALQAYSLSNQPHQLAFLAGNENLLNDASLIKSLIDGTSLGIEHTHISDSNFINPCQNGSLVIDDYQTRIFDNYSQNNELYDEFDGYFSLRTSPSCSYRNYSNSLSNRTITLEGALDYNIFFKNFLPMNTSPTTDELFATVSGNWSVNSDEAGYWSINNFLSEVSYDKFRDNILWTQFETRLEVHDHHRSHDSYLKISTNGALQSEMGVIHPYSGEIIVEDANSNNTMTIAIYSNSIDILINNRIHYNFIDWDDVINRHEYFGLF